MATTEEHIKAITNIQFPETLKSLEHWLVMTGYSRQYIPYYARVVEPLQKRKTSLLAEGQKQGATGPKQSGYVARTKWDPTTEEKEAFEAVQNYLSHPRFLFHFDPARQLFIKLDSSVE